MGGGGGMGGGMGRGGGGMGGGGGHGGGGMGGSGGAETSDNTPAAVVRWESAPLVRDAEVRSESKEFNDAVAGFAKDYYVVSVSSMGAEGRGGWGGGQGAPGGPEGGEGGWGRPDSQQTPEQVETRRKAMDARLIEVTSLTRAGQPIAPERVESVKGSGGRVRLFLFPRSLALDKSTEELAFQTALGPMAVKTKFNLKDMSQSSEPGL